MRLFTCSFFGGGDGLRLKGRAGLRLLEGERELLGERERDLLEPDGPDLDLDLDLDSALASSLAGDGERLFDFSAASSLISDMIAGGWVREIGRAHV